MLASQLCRCALVADIILTFYIGLSSGRFEITPKYAVIPHRGNVNIMCQSQEPLIDCQFRVRYYVDDDRFTSRLLNFDEGGRSKPVTEFRQGLNAVQFRAAYYGSGLSHGQCGLKLTDMDYTRFIVMCRGRDAQHMRSFEYVSMDIRGDKLHIENTSNTHVLREEIAFPGASKSVLFNFPNYVLTTCKFNHPARVIEFRENQEALADRSLQRYHGAGMSVGDCGVELLKVTDQDNGFIWCRVGNSNSYYIFEPRIIIVVKPPDVHELTTLDKPYDVGELVTASCRVAGHRATATITWYLDAELLRRDDRDETYSSTLWFWPYDVRDVRQNFSRRVTADDHGKELKCVVEHVALEETLVKSKVIRVRSATTSKGIHCPPLTSSSIDFHCSHLGKSVNCSLDMAVATEAEMDCKEGYVIGVFTPYTTIRCNQDGNWRGKLLDCVPDCGRRNFVAKELIHGGEEAKAGEFPWHVAIYRKKSDRYEQICGGSLITPTLTVTAAHCVWDSVRHNQLSTSNYKMAAGKYYRDWHTDEELAQLRDISNIFVHPRYEGSILNLASDIAVVKVSDPIVLSRLVNVVCVDWRRESEHTSLYPDVNGTVAGWGITDGGSSSATLITAQLPFVSYEVCKVTVPRDFSNYITADKFCGGWVNRSTAVCPGDSGGGYVFPVSTARGSRYYLRGIVSVGPRDTSYRCNAQQLTVFTKLSEHFSWLIKIVFPQPGEI